MASFQWPSPVQPSGLINVQNYGATGNGTTDDTTSIQNAINTIGTGGALFFPAGNYVVSNITMPGDMTLYGEGSSVSLLRAKPGSTGYMLTDQGDAAHISLLGLGFYGESQSYSSLVRLGYGSTQLGSAGSLLSDLVVRDAPSGVGLDVNANVGYFRNIAGGNLDIGIRALGNANYFDQCSVSGFQTYGIYAGDSFWTELELEAPFVAGSVPFYLLRQVKIWGLVLSLNNTPTTFTNLFVADAGASNCTIERVVIYPGASTYTNFIGGNTAAVTYTDAPGNPLQISASGVFTLTSQASSDCVVRFNTQTNNFVSRIYAQCTSGSTTGQAYYVAESVSNQKWSWGLNQSASSAWQLSATDGLGSSSLTFLQASTAGALTLGAASGTQQHSLNTASDVSATAGSNGAVPSQVAGYITITINGTTQKIPYFNN